MKWNKKQQDFLFVEDEKKYNWSNRQPGLNRRLIYLVILFLSAAILFNEVR